jgi:iron complex outermembrane recepter protein
MGIGMNRSGKFSSLCAQGSIISNPTSFNRLALRRIGPRANAALLCLLLTVSCITLSWADGPETGPAATPANTTPGKTSPDNGSPQSSADNQSLQNLSLAQLGDVEVTTASKEPEQVWRTPAAIYVLTQDDIRRSGATTLPDVLRLVPGLEVAQLDSDHWSVAIRGFSAVLARRLLVLIDGRSVYTPLYGGVYWQVQATPLPDIERIEVIRGPGGTIWGANAVDGIINIITKSAKDTHGTIASLGGGNADNGMGLLRYGTEYGHGFHYRIYGMGFDRNHMFHPVGSNFDDWRMGQAGFRSDWDSGARDTFTLQGDIYREVSGEATTYALYSPPSQVNAFGNAQLTGGNLLGRWKRVLNAGSDFQIQAYFDRTNHFEPEFGETRDTFDVDFLDHLTLPWQQSFLWGLGLRTSPSNSLQLVPSIIFTPSHRTDKIYSGFAQDEISFFDRRFTLTAGSKLEHNNYTGFEVQPSGRLLWNPAPRQSFWASVTRAVRTPSRLDDDIELTDFATVVPLPIYLRVNGNPQFRSEKLRAYEAGYRLLAFSRIYLDAAVFYNQNYDVYSFQVGAPFLELSPAPAHAILPLLTTNGIKGPAKGFEIAPDWKPVRWWELRPSYSHLEMRMEDQPWSNDPTSAAGYNGSSPRHQVAIQSLFTLAKKLEFDQTYRYVSALPAQAVSSYSTADTRFSWHFIRQMEGSVIGQNLMQPYHPEFGGDPSGLVGIKRSVYGQITWTTSD